MKNRFYPSRKAPSIDARTGVSIEIDDQVLEDVTVGRRGDGHAVLSNAHTGKTPFAVDHHGAQAADAAADAIERGRTG
jgi:hypothetical protein